MSAGLSHMTAEQLAAWPDDGLRHELHDGVLVSMTPAGAEHGTVGMMAGYLLMQATWPDRMGRVFNADTGFLLARDPDVLLAPDAAFVSTDRLPTRELPRGFFPGAPDLAIEIVSPRDTDASMEAKAHLYLTHGTSTVWVLVPAMQSVRVYQPDAEMIELASGDELTTPLIPGFACRVRDFFA